MSKQDKKVVGDVKTFTVDRSKWLRGKGPEDSSLLNQKGKMCCLGFYAEACGLDRKFIRHLKSPAAAVTASKEDFTLHKSGVIWKTELVNRNGDSATCYQMMAVNDNEDIKDDVRETKLTALFKKLNIKIKFK